MTWSDQKAFMTKNIYNSIHQDHSSFELLFVTIVSDVNFHCFVKYFLSPLFLVPSWQSGGKQKTSQNKNWKSAEEKILSRFLPNEFLSLSTKTFLNITASSELFFFSARESEAEDESMVPLFAFHNLRDLKCLRAYFYVPLLK